ncbi:MAG: hydantoinase/oxoprolinase family protein, partial [Candidatus Brocadiia bacterium]|nr:hydantoinase/oxoprolinase family protein [Candidatus Brocadiia bacterium]
SLSVDVLPEVREYERTSTTVVNAYLGPIVKAYVESLLRQLRDAGVEAPLRMMQSNGGVMSAAKAAESPVQIVESGPAAGVVAAHRVGQRIGVSNIISFDMGGTTAKASLIEDGRLSRTTEYEIGAGISLSSRLVKGGGHAVKVPVVDLAEIGAGGGSIVWVDRGGALKVGPQSAGAMPGPACYGAGGEEPTVTDANAVLGFLNPGYLAGGAVELKPELARVALQEKVATPLGTGLLEAAYGVHTVANVTMIRAIRAVSTYRGRDPRDFTLLAFGGSGPVHAVEMARSLRIGRVVVPPAPGLLSAVGLLEALPEYHFVQTFFSRIADTDLAALSGAYGSLEARAIGDLVAEGYVEADILRRRSADLRYVGQAYELTVEAPAGDIGPDEVAALVER